jgi:hypothetical protein
MRSEIFVPLLVSGIFRDEVKVFTADDESSVHLGGDNCTGQDAAADGDETSERAFLVCLKCDCQHMDINYSGLLTMHDLMSASSQSLDAALKTQIHGWNMHDLVFAKW